MTTCMVLYGSNDMGGVMNIVSCQTRCDHAISAILEVFLNDSKTFVTCEVATEEEFLMLHLTFQLPIEPGVHHAAVGTAIGLFVGTAMTAFGVVSQHDWYFLDCLVVHLRVLPGYIRSATNEIQDRPMQVLQRFAAGISHCHLAHYLMFDNRHPQPLVDAAFLAEGILRAPTQIWGRLDQQTRDWLVKEWKTSRGIKPFECNWLLFASIIEAALLEFTGECDMERLMYGVNRFRNEWYKGDGWYGDGLDFHLDYYNSLVIHPMFTETLKILKKHDLAGADFLPTQTERHGRLAAELERMISPEGSYPVTGRSIVYRFGSFHALADAALLHILPANISPAQVRCALTAVIQRQLSRPLTFDQNGWLRIGYTGSQIRMSEDYINTGSLYLCTTAFLPLGLPVNDPFWSAPACDWTAKKAWNGQDVGADHAIH